MCWCWQESAKLAAAYGIAVSGTMLATTVLRYLVSMRVWQRPMLIALVPAVLFGIGDCIFLFCNTLKIADGGWLPIAIGLVLTFLMLSQLVGTASVLRELERSGTDVEEFVQLYRQMKLPALPGVGIVCTKLHEKEKIPPAFMHNLNTGGVLKRHTVFYSVQFAYTPKVRPEDRYVYQTIETTNGVRLIESLETSAGWNTRTCQEPCL